MFLLFLILELLFYWTLILSDYTSHDLMIIRATHISLHWTASDIVLTGHLLYEESMNTAFSRLNQIHHIGPIYQLIFLWPPYFVFAISTRTFQRVIKNWSQSVKYLTKAEMETATSLYRHDDPKTVMTVFIHFLSLPLVWAECLSTYTF